MREHSTNCTAEHAVEELKDRAESESLDNVLWMTGCDKDYDGGTLASNARAHVEAMCRWQYPRNEPYLPARNPPPKQMNLRGPVRVPEGLPYGASGGGYHGSVGRWIRRDSKL